MQPFSIFLFSLLQAPVLDVRNKHKAMMKIKSWLLAGCFVLGGAGHAETPMVAPPESLRIEGAPAIPLHAERCENQNLVLAGTILEGR